MSWKVFGQIILLMIIGVLILSLLKPILRKRPILGKYAKPCHHSVEKVK